MSIRVSATRLYSTACKPATSKARLHQPIPNEHFPSGFRLSAVHAGIKKSSHQLDLALVLSDTPRAQTAAAACFTENAFKAAPVLVSEQILASNQRARALVVNSGCANAVTGAVGLQNAWAMSSATDVVLSRLQENPDHSALDSGSPKETMVMSTGVIGHNLPISSVLDGIERCGTSLASDFTAWENTAKAFMTTDTFPKLRAKSFILDDTRVRMAGIDKGAGMIHPRMSSPKRSSSLHATLLGFVATDAYITPDALQSALQYAVSRSFNSISVDGDMSTNDTIVAIANGAAGMKKPIDLDSPSFQVFRNELTEFCIELAQLVVRDGEGARKFVSVKVEGAVTYPDAHKIASTISTSMLVKTALYGEDANWGRILASAGSLSGCLSKPLDPGLVSVYFTPSSSVGDSSILKLLTNGEPEYLDEERAKAILCQEDINITVQLGLGTESATYYTCDLSHEYVSINGDYRS